MREALLSLPAPTGRSELKLAVLGAAALCVCCNCCGPAGRTTAGDERTAALRASHNKDLWTPRCSSFCLLCRLLFSSSPCYLYHNIESSRSPTCSLYPPRFTSRSAFMVPPTQYKSQRAVCLPSVVMQQDSPAFLISRREC